MEEIIYKIDNWTIVKLLGGTAIIIAGVIAFFSKIISTKISQSGQHKFDKNIEDLKGEISKNNNVLSSVIQNYFSSSQKILEKKIQAYDLLWTSILEIKGHLPSGIMLIYQIFSDSEISKSTAFNNFDTNPSMGPLLKTYSNEKELKPFFENKNSFMSYKPYISDNSYKLYYTYNALIGRIIHQFIWNYENKKIYNWKQDDHLEGILKVTLTEKELEYIKSVSIGALPALMDLLEYKILQDFRDNLNIKSTTEDTIKYLKDIEKILSK